MFLKMTTVLLNSAATSLLGVSITWLVVLVLSCYHSSMVFPELTDVSYESCV